jgi:hypothetical protein
MKKLIQEEVKEIIKSEAKIVEEEGGLITLLGKTVCFHCMNYNYVGRLTGVNTADIQLDDMHVVFETGAYTGNCKKNAECITKAKGFLRLSAIEAYWEV